MSHMAIVAIVVRQKEKQKKKGYNIRFRNFLETING